MKIPFISGEGPDGYLPVNLYFSPKKIYGRDALVGRPGLLEFADTGSSAKIRAMCATKTSCFAISGNSLCEIDAFGNSNSVGTLLHSVGTAWMEWNGSQIGIVDNGVFYVYENDTLTKIDNDGLSFNPGSLCFESGYFLAHESDSENFFESSLYDGTDWNELDYAITSVKPDKLFCVYATNGRVYAFGKQSGEVYYNSGGSSFSFSKIQGGNIPCGISSEKGVGDFNGTLIGLNNNGVVVQFSTTPVKLSNEHVDRAIENMEKTNDATGFVFSMAGHTFFVLTFPAGNKTFVLDLTSKHWYEWRTGTGRWRPNCYVKCYGKHLVGDYTNGKIYELSQTTYSDDGDEITFQRTASVQKDSNFYTFSTIELEQEGGVGLSTGQGSDPKVVLQYSADKGKTWSPEKWRDIGKAGKYKQRVLWRRIGRHRHLTVKITVTDPVKVVWTGMYINDNG